MIKNEQQLQFGYVKGTFSSIQNNRILENVKSVDHAFCISLYFWVLVSKAQTHPLLIFGSAAPWDKNSQVHLNTKVLVKSQSGFDLLFRKYDCQSASGINYWFIYWKWWSTTVHMMCLILYKIKCMRFDELMKIRRFSKSGEKSSILITVLLKINWEFQ